MKNVQKCLLRSRKPKFITTLSRKAALIMAAIALISIPLAVQAETVSQLTALQWLVNLCGDGKQFTASSSPQDYVQWAQAKGMNPTGGWSPTAKLTKDALAQILVQMYNLNPKKGGGDYIKILAREGITLPDEQDITREGLIHTFAESFQPRVSINPSTGRPNNGHGGDTPPPHNPNGNPHINPPGNSGNAPGHNK